MENWISKLKIGDEVLTIEKHPNIPNGEWVWKSKVTAIESSYIETEYRRDSSLDWVVKLTENLAGHHRTYFLQTVKNYFGPDGSINIKQK